MDKIYLAENLDMLLDQERNPINLNQIVCGSTGSGKTLSYVDPILAHVQDTNLIVTCTKSRLARQYSASLKQRGYKVHHLNLADPKRSTCHYNPLHYLKSDEDLIALARGIVQTGHGHASKDPFWEEQAALMIQALLGYTLTLNKKSLKELKQLVDLADPDCGADSGMQSPVNWLFEELSRKDPDNPACRRWKKFSGMPVKTYSTILSIVNQVMEALFPQSIAEMAANHRLQTLDFERFASEKSVLFITTSPVNPALHKLAHLIYDQIFRSLFELGERRPDGRLLRPVHVIADDFGTGSPVPGFAEKISIFREKGISMSMLIQDQSQLNSLYGQAAANTITNNCDSYLYYGGIDIETCQMVSKKANRPFGEILEMPLGHLWLIQRGTRSRLLKRYPTLEDKSYQEIKNLNKVEVPAFKRRNLPSKPYGKTVNLHRN